MVLWLCRSCNSCPYIVKILSIICYIILDNFSSVLLQSSRYQLYVYFRSSGKTFFPESLLSRKRKICCEDCGVETTRRNSLRYTRICSLGTPYSAKGLGFGTKYQNELFLLFYFSQSTVDFWICRFLWKQLDIGERLTDFKSRKLFSCEWLSNVSVNHILTLSLLQPIFPLCTLFAELVRTPIVVLWKFVVRVSSFFDSLRVLLVLFCNSKMKSFHIKKKTG